jgi:cell wall-associated NlpC family hydrolase
MEGQIEPACYAKRPFIILPILLTLTIFNTTLYATNENPTPPANELTFKAVPIIANTLEAYHNLKTAHAPQPKESVKQLDAAQLASVAAVSEKESTAKTLVTESVSTIKEEKVSSETTAAVNNMTSTSFSFAALEKSERRQYIAYFAESHTDWGFRYRFGGTAIDNGIDCSAFTRYILNYFDIKAPRTSQEQYEVGEKITVEQARAGDLVFFGGKKSITHVAVVVSNDEKGLVVVHSCNRGILKENITESSYWKPKLKSLAVNLFDSSQTK